MTSDSNVLLDKIEPMVLPLANRISNLPTLVAIRSALIITLPIVFLGSLAELLISFPLESYRSFMTETFGSLWIGLGSTVRNATFGVLSLIMAFSLGQHLAARHNSMRPFNYVSPVIGGLISFVSLLCLLYEPSGDIFASSRWLGVAGLFVAMVVGLVSGNIFLFFFSCRIFRLRIPGGAPDLVIAQGFNALIPGILTVLFFTLLGFSAPSFIGVSIHEGVHHLIRIPFEWITDGLSRGMMYILSLQSLWFFGVHGANVLDPITHDMYGAAMEANVLAHAAGLPLPNIMTKTFMDIFVFMGGSGSALSLAIALVLFGKTPANRKLGGIGLAPCIFNINEVLLFGLPVILNPIMLIPFICTPLVLAAISYLAVFSGLVPGTGAYVAWTTPIFFNSYISTGSFWGPVLQAFNLTVGIGIYLPFIVLSNRINEKRTNAAFVTLNKRACSVVDNGTRCLNNYDDAGSLARNLLGDLAYDVENGNGLYLEYQPQVDACSGKVVGVESLIRWRHNFYGNIPAPIVISLAEESGLIRSMGLTVFEEACKTRRKWLDAGLTDLVMAVNISALQLTETFKDDLIRILRKYDLEPAMLELEVTESSALDTNTLESRLLSKLHAYGFPLAIDDFGMGHSSLKYLKLFPVDTVKIDGEIIREVITNPICADIVSSITRLCKVRGITSVAEFVETEEQALLLRSLGCDVFQGWRYSKSLVEDKCLRFIEDNRKRLTPGFIEAGCNQEVPTSGYR